MSKQVKFVASLFVAGILLGLVLAAAWMSPPVAPPALAQESGWATPQGAAFGGGEWSMVPYINNVGVLTPADLKYCSSGMQTAAYVMGDFQTVYDEHSANVVSCTLEFSNDDTNWCIMDDTNWITHSLSGDDNSCDELHLFGRYSRVCCWSSEGELFTITVRAKVFN